jgi:hypothetical protein
MSESVWSPNLRGLTFLLADLFGIVLAVGEAGRWSLVYPTFPLTRNADTRYDLTQ